MTQQRTAGGTRLAAALNRLQHIMRAAEPDATLMASEHVYRSLSNAIPAIVSMARPDGSMRYFNTRWFAYTGLDAAEPDGWRKAVHPDDYERLMARWKQSMQDGEAIEVECRLRRADGEYRWHLGRSVDLRDDNGSVIASVLAAIDIHDRQEAEQQVVELNRELERRVAELRAVLDLVPVGIGIADDPACESIRINRELARMLGVPPDANPSKSAPTAGDLPFKVLRDGQEVPAGDLPLQRAAATGAPVTDVESEIVHADGTSVDLLEYATPLFDDSGSVIGSVGAFVDITARRRAEDALRVSEERYRTLANVIPQVVWTARPDGSVDFCNQRWLDYSGLTLEESIGTGWQRTLHPDDAQHSRDVTAAAVAAGEPYEIECRLRRVDGVHRWHLSRALPVRDNDDRIVAWFGACTDIDDEKRAGERLRNLQLVTDGVLMHMELDPLLDELMSRMHDVLGADVADIWLLAPDGEHLLLRASYGLHDDLSKGMEIHITQGPAGRIAQSRAPLVFNTVSTVELAHQRLRDAGVRSMAGAPLIVKDELIGVINLGSTTPRQFTPDDVLLLQLIADRAALAIAHVRLYQAERAARASTEEAERRVAFLAEASRVLNSSLNYKDTLRSLARLAVPVLADWCGVDAIDESGRIRRLAVAHLDPEKEQWARDFGRRFPSDPESQTGTAAVLRTGRSVLIPEVSDDLLAGGAGDSEQLRLLRAAAVKSYMCVPLAAHGRTLGALTLVTADSGRRLGAVDLALAEDLVGRAAIAADNARLYREAQRTTVDLRVANRAKDEFLGLVSHELRTPITTIYGNAQVIRTRAQHLDAESLRLAVADIEQEAERLERIVENMLVLARIETGREVVTEPLLVQRMVTRLVEMHRVRHPHRIIEVDVAHDLDPVAAERTYFEQILRNLLSNAEKYSPRSAPIEVRATRNSYHVTVFVLDRGSGIASEEAEHIFSAFYRSRRTMNDASGTGIGLAVCKRLVEAQAGTIWARPRSGGGSEFGFALPLVKEATT